MIKLSNRWKHWIAPAVLGLGLCVAPAFSPAARAQEDPADPNAKSEGRPFDGYAATTTLLLLALFIVGKSARR
jgi:hypothetical protein